MKASVIFSRKWKKKKYLAQRSVRNGEINVFRYFYSWEMIVYCRSTIPVWQYLKLKTCLQESRWTPTFNFPLLEKYEIQNVSCHESFSLCCGPGVWSSVPPSGWNRELQVCWAGWVTFMKADEWCGVKSFKVHDALGCNFPGLVISYLMCLLYTFSTRYRLSIFVDEKKKSPQKIPMIQMVSWKKQRKSIQ